MLDWATAADEFWGHVEPGGDCWHWTGGFAAGNAIVGNVDGVEWSAHRFAYILLVGPIPAGSRISRACQNTACVNPDHLEFVAPNGSFQPGRTRHHKPAKTFCPKGHLYDKVNMYRRDKRVCDACQQLRPKPRPKKKRKRARRKTKVIVHGKNSTYQAGCRCDDCKEAAREYRREYNARRKPAPEPRACAWCKVEFQPRRLGNVLFCSPKCRGASYRSEHGPTPSNFPPSPQRIHSPRQWALVTEWYIEPDPDLVMLQEIAAQQPPLKPKRNRRRKSA